ncbi:killer cell lectin-like receptor subfamily G member 2 [Eretmochelys imbricata]
MDDEEGYTALNLRPKRGGSEVSLLVSEKGQTPAAPGSNGAGSRDPSTAECSARLERFRSQLCPPAQPGPAGPIWEQWIRQSSPEAAVTDTGSQAGHQLPVPRSLQEFLKDLTQGSCLFWIGLSVSSSEKAWTWLDGSRLDQTLLPVSGPAEGNSCGVVNENRIGSDTCSSAFQLICQRDASSRSQQEHR